MSTPVHTTDLPPSEWVTRWSASIAAGGRVLDVACGAGRHARWLASRGFRVLAVDIDIGRFADPPDDVETLQVDLEAGSWPLRDRLFDAVVVTNYLHRERFADLLAAVSPGGILIYETFMAGNERFGKPSNPDFLLQAGELARRVSPDFEVLGFEEGEVSFPRPAMIQRICARRLGP